MGNWRPIVQIRVSTRQTTVSDRDHSLIVEKIERLSKYLPGMDTAEVHFSEERNPRIADKEVCEVTLEGHGHHVRCRANGPDHLTAIDRAVEKLENKLHKLKTKLAAKPRHRSSARMKRAGVPEGTPEDMAVVEVDLEDTEADEWEPDETAELRIVKVKSIEKMVLGPQDAAERMDLMEHGFYFFTNIETGRSAVVYRRADGDVGLIDEDA